MTHPFPIYIVKKNIQSFSFVNLKGLNPIIKNKGELIILFYYNIEGSKYPFSPILLHDNNIQDLFLFSLVR